MQEMNLLDKFTDVYTTNQYVYKSNDSIGTLRNKIKFLIDQEEILDFKYNLTGILRTDNSFQLVRKAGLGRIKSWDREPMTITGKLVPDGSKNTRIEMEIKPNFIFLLFSVLFGIIGAGALLSFLHTQDEKSKQVGAGFLLVFPIMWIMANYTKRFYKTEFESALDLQPESIPVSRTIKL